MMPALALIGIPGWRWQPPIPVPLCLLWPFVPICLGIATHTFRGMRGVTIDVNNARYEQAWIRIA